MKYKYRDNKNFSWKSISGINVMIFLFVFLIIFVQLISNGIGSGYQFGDIKIWLIVFLCVSLVFFLFYRKQISKNIFEISDNGVVVKNKVYKWRTIKSLHWLGEAQSERVGAFKLGNLGPSVVNPYSFSEYQIARLKIKRFIFSKYLNLKISSKEVEKFSKEMSDHGVKQKAGWRHYVGI